MIVGSIGGFVGACVGPRSKLWWPDQPHGRFNPSPTAILVYNDLTAIGALHSLRAAGLAVPGDVAVVGTDGIELGRFVAPPLTTVAHPAAELGRLGVETLFERLAGRAPERERTLATRLVVRESCGAGA